MVYSPKGRSSGPRFNLLLRLRLWQKFVLLGIVAVALAAFPTYRLFKGAQVAISQARTEETGLVAITAALELPPTTRWATRSAAPRCRRTRRKWRPRWPSWPRPPAT
jgi:hypothetical protein